MLVGFLIFAGAFILLLLACRRLWTLGKLAPRYDDPMDLPPGAQRGVLPAEGDLEGQTDYAAQVKAHRQRHGCGLTEPRR